MTIYKNLSPFFCRLVESFGIVWLAGLRGLESPTFCGLDQS